MSQEEKSLKRRVLITGGSRGIGAGIAEAAARRGHTNLLVGRNESAMRELVEEWRREGNGRDHCYLALDLTGPDARRRLIEWLDQVGRPDTFIHNAAVGFFGPFPQTDLAKHGDTISLGVRMTVELTHALLPALSRTPNSYIVYVGSTSGRKPVPYMSVYSSTKAFIHHFAIALREELRGGPPSVLLAVPGGVQTDFPRLAGLPASFTAKGLLPAEVGETIMRAIDDGRSGTLPIGRFAERHGGLLQRILPPAFWARTMGRAYARLLGTGPR